MARTKPKQETQRATPPEAEAVASRLRRSHLALTPKDHLRLRILMAKQDLTWQDTMSEALSDWLERRGEARLERIK